MKCPASGVWCTRSGAQAPAVALGDRDKGREACAALEPAADEIAGAASGLLTAGPVRDYLTEAAPLLG
jgi:hypothetical protein